jgi:hypothetical protein
LILQLIKNGTAVANEPHTESAKYFLLAAQGRNHGGSKTGKQTLVMAAGDQA